MFHSLYAHCTRESCQPGSTITVDGQSIVVILAGRVRLLDNEQEQTVRLLNRGDIFGHFALIRDMQVPYTADVSEAVDLLRISKIALLPLFKTHPFINAWFHADLRRFERELGAFDDAAGSRFLFGQRLRDLEHGHTPQGDVNDSIRTIAQQMSAHQCDHVVITDADNRPLGILSDRGLRERVVATGHAVDSPVADVMRRDFLTIDARASVFDGLLAMEQQGWNHLVLLNDDGILQGVLSGTDLARTLLASPSALRHRINQAESGSQLRELRRAADQIVITLYRRGVRADDLLKMNTRFNDAMTRRVLALVERELPAPPVELTWCWMSLGSEGRGEMGLLTDQDNGIIYECQNLEAADEWLGQLAERSNNLLHAAGINLCDGGIMAKESAMRHNLENWKVAIEQWLENPDDVRMLWVSALYDARHLHGDKQLFNSLQHQLSELISQRRHVLRVFAREALQPELPFRRFPGLRLRGNRSDQGPSLNMKRQGTHLITHATRLLCMNTHLSARDQQASEHTATGAIEHSSTTDRLQWLGESQPDLQHLAQEALIAYGVLVDMRLSWQIHQASRDDPLTDVMPLAHFGETRQRLLLSAYQTVEEMRLRIQYQFGVPNQ